MKEYTKFFILCAAVLILASCQCVKKGCSSSASAAAEAECQKNLRETGVLTDGNGSVLVSDRTFFAFNESDLTPASKKTLDSQAAWLNSSPETHIMITGHCDERGTREYNIGLGERRANAARDYLVSVGINPSRLQVSSKGKDDPLVMGSTEEAWAQNRVAVVSSN
jgi:peptidoglycan-associated lipoprotein